LGRNIFIMLIMVMVAYICQNFKMAGRDSTDL
jgi:hypothetical protein